MNILVYIASEAVWTIPPAQVDRLQERFPQHRFTNAANPEQARAAIGSADIVFSSLVTPELFASASGLRWIHSPAAGIGRLLFPALVASDVVLTNSRGLHAIPIAEHVLGLAVALSRQFQVACRRQAEHQWSKDEIGHVRVLHGHTLGIVGLGAIGSAIARLGIAFGMRVSGVRRRVDAAKPEGIDHVYPAPEIDRVLSDSDYVVLAAPLTRETTGMIGRRELRLMKRSAFLINIARGKLIRENELAEELRAGTLAGAGLDVFEHEPLDSSSPLWDLPNVIITPHTSGFFEGYWDAVADMFARNLIRYDGGESLFNVVDKTAGY